MAKVFTGDYFYKVPGDMIGLIYKLRGQVENEDLVGICLTVGQLAEKVKQTNFERITEKFTESISETLPWEWRDGTKPRIPF